MKRALWHLAALLLCLLILQAPMATADDAGQTRLLITQAAYDPADGLLTVGWTNTGDETVTGAELRVIPRNAEDRQAVIDEGYIEDILLEQRIFHTFVAAAPGESVTVAFSAGTRYPEAVRFDIAFDRITMESGVSLELPENRLCWYSTQENAYVSVPEESEPYAPPADDVLAKAAENPFGLTAIAVTNDLAEAYGFSHSGMMIVAIEENSLAEAIGLLPGDLIYSVNGAQYADEPYIVSLAAAALADNLPVTLLIERDDIILSMTLEPGSVFYPIHRDKTRGKRR